MKVFRISVVLLVSCLGLPSRETYAVGGLKGAGGGGRMAAGHAMPAGRPSVPNLSRPAGGSGMNMSNLNRPTGNTGFSRPSTSQPSISRPSVSRPSVSRPSVSQPNISRPTATLPNINPPSTNTPSFGRPSGGMKPSTRPDLSGNRPSTLPGNISRPTTRPDLDVNRPSTLPGNLTRPTTRPSFPNLGGDLSRPGLTRPNFPDINPRPLPGDVGDFLGMDRPLRPETLPGITRPSERPSFERPSERPNIGSINRPDRPLRPGGGGGFNMGDLNFGNNTVISSRPNWVTINNNQIISINNRWQNQMVGLQNWPNRYPARIHYWNHWGNGVRNRWSYYHHHGNWFGPNWWSIHYHNCGGWHYGYRFNYYPWTYWWTVPTFNTFATWFTWSAPSAVWTQPIYYDYGQGGNVIYENNNVYINGQAVATATDFAQSAAALATVAPPEDQQMVAEAEWLPLGTFAVSSSEKDVSPHRVLQLAVTREGIVSGTLFNTQTEKTDTIQGKVDKETQRVAFRIGESEDVVVESGLYNLTQDEAPVLVHFAGERVENWLLVRLENPESEDSFDTP